LTSNDERVDVTGRQAFFGTVSLAVAAVVAVTAVLGRPAVGVASLLLLVVVSFGLYVVAWARNVLAWRRERPVSGRTPEAEPRSPAGVGLEPGS
jgi:uncharacterized membrane protein